MEKLCTRTSKVTRSVLRYRTGLMSVYGNKFGSGRLALILLLTFADSGAISHVEVRCIIQRKHSGYATSPRACA